MCFSLSNMHKSVPRTQAKVKLISLKAKKHIIMKRIGLLSDTHGCWDYSYLDFFSSCDEVWHAGDIGSVGIIERFESFRPFRAVYGNIDQAHRRLSRTLRPLGGWVACRRPAANLHQRPLAHPPRDVRQTARHPARQSWCCGTIRAAQGQDAGTVHHRRWQGGRP